MGDRSNLYFRNGKHGVGVYAHWSGVAMADAAMAVLKNPAFKKRLGDASYATRIAVQTAFAVLEASPKEETGFGLWTSENGPDDNEYRFIVIDVGSGECFVAKDWKRPRTSERIVKPTARILAAKMQA